MTSRDKKILIIDLGSSSIRFFTMDQNAVMTLVATDRLPTEKLRGNIATIDVSLLPEMLLNHASAIIKSIGSVAAVAITNQRASTVIYDKTQRPLGKAISWQDFRTIGRCMTLAASHDIHLAPNHSATKIEVLLDMFDKERLKCDSYRVGTLDNYVASVLSKGKSHITDMSNASLTGLIDRDTLQYDGNILKALNIPKDILPDLVNSIDVVGYASLLPDSPPIATILGDQQASMIGQGCIEKSMIKATFGTGAMVDVNTGNASRNKSLLGPYGCTEIVAYKTPESCHYGVEAIGLSAGSALDWLCGDLGLIKNPAESDTLAANVQDSGGVCFVPAQQGLGTPVWDFGAKAILTGIGPATTKSEIVRAVLEGIANIGVDLIEAALGECAITDRSLAVNVDGGMSTNDTFLQLLADLTFRPIHVAGHSEATAYGAGLAALVAIGHYKNLKEATTNCRPGRIINPLKKLDRQRWLEARSRAEKNVPALSAIKF